MRLWTLAGDLCQGRGDLPRGQVPQTAAVRCNSRASVSAHARGPRLVWQPGVLVVQPAGQTGLGGYYRIAGVCVGGRWRPAQVLWVKGGRALSRRRRVRVGLAARGRPVIEGRSGYREPAAGVEAGQCAGGAEQLRGAGSRACGGQEAAGDGARGHAGGSGRDWQEPARVAGGS
jgi:hypothetical protein